MYLVMLSKFKYLFHINYTYWRGIYFFKRVQWPCHFKLYWSSSKYENIGKYQNLKDKMYGFFSSQYLSKSYLKINCKP